MPVKVFSDAPLGLKAKIEAEPVPMHPRVRALISNGHLVMAFPKQTRSSG